MKPEAVEKRFKHRLPRSDKNPRKIKKAWKKLVLGRLFELHGRNASRGMRYKLRWLPGTGWCVTCKLTKMGRRKIAP